MNSVHPLQMDPRCIPLGMVRTQVPGSGMMIPPPPIIGRHQLVRHAAAAAAAGRMPYPGLGGPGPPPLQGQNIYVEDQMDHLAGKLDMLENELRYAWRALDVLSQEYIKMWERMEKLEGLLTEQQTVITQLIDLYTADSSDNADNEFDSNGRDITNFSNFGGKAPDESFYKALNMVHQNSYPNTGEPLAITNFNAATANMTNLEKSPKKPNKTQPKGPHDVGYIENFNMMAQNNGSVMKMIREDSDGDLKSMSSSMRSTQSGQSDVAEFPVPADTSPTYENLMSAGTLVTSVANSASNLGPTHKRKLPQLPHPTDNTRRTRKDGYVGDQALAGNNVSQSVSNVFTSAAGNIQNNEVSYDTYPRRKKKKDKQIKKKDNEEVSADSPLTVIDGNYSFNISGEKDVQSLERPSGAPSGQTNQKSGQVGDGANKSHGDKEIREIKPKQQMVDSKSEKQTKNPQGAINNTQNLSVIHQHKQQQQQQPQQHHDTQSSDNSLTRASANSLFQQIQAREAESGGVGNKGRKLSLKEKRKLRAERDLTEFLPKSVEVEEPPQQAPVFRRPDHSNSESDVSMRSDISPKRDSDDVEPLLAANGMSLLDQQGQSRARNSVNSAAMNLLQPAVQQLSSKPNSREFAVSRALGKYRQKKKERESSNSDSQDELEIGADMRGNVGIENTLKSLDAKLAEIEESVEPDRSISVADAQKAIPVQKVHHQLNKFEEAGVRPIEPGRAMSRKVSEESIDTDDEWYRHEMIRLQRMEAGSGAAMTNVIGQLNQKLTGQDVKVQDINKVGQPPDRPPGDPPDSEKTKRVHRRSSKKQLLRKSTTSEQSDSSVTGSADDDSDTQSGEDYVDDNEDYAEVKKPAAVAAQPRPGNLTLTHPQQTLNISGLPNKPDLLEELTAAAAEDHYPDHLKHGYFGEDGIWYDDHGETGYWGEDGEWYDYMDEIGYYSDDGGTWHEYDYSTGYWDDEGEWRLKEPATAPATNNTGKEADHFLWVSEEGTNEFANDQVPSSELTTHMVIGKPASCFIEESCPTNQQDTNINITNGNIIEPEEATAENNKINQHQMNHITSNHVDKELIYDEMENSGRWGSIMKDRRMEILLLVRH